MKSILEVFIKISENEGVKITQLEEKIFLINDFIIEEHTKRYPVTKAMSCETLNQEAG